LPAPRARSDFRVWSEAEVAIETTSDRVFARCERSDRLFRTVLGSTPVATVRWFGPLLVVVIAAAAIASVLGWPVR
jgi:hypothetical protein